MALILVFLSLIMFPKYVIVLHYSWKFYNFAAMFALNQNAEIFSHSREIPQWNL